MPINRCYGCGFPRVATAQECQNCGRHWDEPPTDDEFWNAILEAAHWLFYGDLDEHFGAFVHGVLSSMEQASDGGWSFGPFGFVSSPHTKLPLEPTFAVAYWLFLSELVALDLAQYGTSPRGAWLTKDGERFRRIALERFAAGTLEWVPDHAR